MRPLPISHLCHSCFCWEHCTQQASLLSSQLGFSFVGRVLLSMNYCLPRIFIINFNQNEQSARNIVTMHSTFSSWRHNSEGWMMTQSEWPYGTLLCYRAHKGTTQSKEAAKTVSSAAQCCGYFRNLTLAWPEFLPMVWAQREQNESVTFPFVTTVHRSESCLLINSCYWCQGVHFFKEKWKGFTWVL